MRGSCTDVYVYANIHIKVNAHIHIRTPIINLTLDTLVWQKFQHTVLRLNIRRWKFLAEETSSIDNCFLPADPHHGLIFLKIWLDFKNLGQFFAVLHLKCKPPSKMLPQHLTEIPWSSITCWISKRSILRTHGKPARWWFKPCRHAEMRHFPSQNWRRISWQPTHLHSTTLQTCKGVQQVTLFIHWGLSSKLDEGRQHPCLVWIVWWLIANARHLWCGSVKKWSHLLCCHNSASGRDQNECFTGFRIKGCR